MPKNIKLPEHNSSRLLFISNNSNNINLTLNELEQVSESQEKDRCTCNEPKFFLGKLNNNIWLLEDCSEYDTNHTHKAEIINSNTNEVIYNVTRIMEYSEECDRLYTEHSGGIKFILVDSPSTTQEVNLYIKYERSLPCAANYIGSLTIDNQKYNGCVLFYKYNSNNQLGLSEVTQIVGNLIINDDITNQPLTNINYANIDLKSASIDFNKLSIKYNISENTTNDIQIGYIGTKSIIPEGSYNYYGKFISKEYYNNNDNFIEPGCFIINVPKNRSWICYRYSYGPTYPGYSEVTNYNTDPKEMHKKDDKLCCFITNTGASLNGYYGNLVNNKYEYTINITNRVSLPFLLMIPEIFCNDNELTLKYYNSNNDEVNYDGGNWGSPITTNYNELDGMFYQIITVCPSSSIYKIKLIYNV